MASLVLSLYGLLMGTIYPAYCSFCAIQTKDSSDDKQWLTYWIIASFWSLINTFGYLFTIILIHYF